jgi:hypothetical protein
LVVTLAVAVLCPFPFNLHEDVPKTGIVLVGDTRYSFGDGTPPNDRGIKIVQLGAGSAVAFAGDVESAQHAAMHLTPVFSGPLPSYAPDLFNEEIEGALADAAAETGRWSEFAMLLAFSTANGLPVLMALGPTSPIPVSVCSWGAMIGDRRPGDEMAFESLLRAEIMKPDMMRGYVNDPKHWMFPVAEAFHEFMKVRPRGSVGGALQVAVVSVFDGFRQNDIFHGRRREDGGFDWELMTPPVSFN